MSAVRRAGLVLGTLVVVGAAGGGAYLLARGAPPKALLLGVTPLQVSNQTDYPLVVFGRALPEGAIAQLRIADGPEVQARLETSAIDADHRTAVLPAGLPLDPRITRQRASLRLVTHDGLPIPGEAELFVVNDAAFSTPLSLMFAADDTTPVVVSETTDDRWIGGEQPRHEPTCDGPRDQATWRAPGGEAVRVTLCTYASVLELKPESGGDLARIPVTGRPQALVIDPLRHRAYVSGLVEDAVDVIDLGARKSLRKIPVHVNPRALLLSPDGDTLWVSHMGSEDLVRVTLEPTTLDTVEVGPGAEIIGGHTEVFRARIMGDKPARALAFARRQGLVVAATIGPNIGPNPERLEVSMNGGLTLVKGATFLRHVSIGRGVPQALAIDDEAQVVYVADGATGRVLAYDLARLAGTPAEARTATIAEYVVPVPVGTPLVRPSTDFGVNGRAQVSLHTGPWALALSQDRRRLAVLLRFVEHVDVLDVSAIRRVGFVPRSRTAFGPPETQGTRRRGETLYFTDLGNSRMTCDTCHPEGRDGGLLFTKGHPMQIHRSPSTRSAHHSAPFFTPSRLPSLAVMAHQVLGRNRFENPEPTRGEIAALTEYTTAFTPPPNPWRARGLAEKITLPDGHTGDPRAGLAVFGGAGACASCHPWPHFTTDQAPDTRGRLHDVGTPLRLELHPELQDNASHGMPPPSLVGVWDNFPLLFSGAGGFSVVGERVVADHPFALRRVLELNGPAPHGAAAALTPAQRDDLLAFLLTL